MADADGATDQFALAVMAYEMLTGRNPFQAVTIREVFALVLHSDPPPMGVGRDVELVVRRGLAKSNREGSPPSPPSPRRFVPRLPVGCATASGRRRSPMPLASSASHNRKEQLGRRVRGMALTRPRRRA